MPGAYCIYIGTYEDELLINPYQCYSFLKKEGNHYYYTIHPLSIIPPNDENEFSQFKRNVVTRTVIMEGGKNNNKEQNSKIATGDYSKTYRLKNNKNTRHTKKNTKPKKRSPIELFKARMSLPIGTSSFSISLTPEMIKANEECLKEIEEHLKNGSYYPL